MQSLLLIRSSVNQESAVHVGTAEYTANAGGWRTKAEVRIQVTGNKLKVSMIMTSPNLLFINWEYTGK
jgi:hypothetical protein